MALSFLNNLAPILNLAGGIYGQMQSNKAINKYNVPTSVEKQSQALYAAMADPNSPLMQQYTQEAKNNNMADFLSQLRGMQNADRRQQSLGRSPTFFNPERSDEAMSFLTSRGLPQMNQMATQQAQQRILQAAGGIEHAQAPQEQRLQTGMMQGISNAGYQSQIPQQILDIFSQMQKPKPQYAMASSQYGPQQYNQKTYQ